MWKTPPQELLDRIPRLYETEGTPLKDKLIHLHFFMFGCDWYVAEYDGENLFFGYAILNGDTNNAEWGYVQFSELKEINIQSYEVEFDEYWQVRPASEIDKIKT